MADGAGLDPEQEAAQRALAHATRRVIDEVRRTRAPVRDLDAARAALEEAARLLEPHRHGGRLAQADLLGGIGRFGESDDPMVYFPYSPIIGRANPIAPPVELHCEDGVVHGRVRFTAPYCGPPEHVHGGVVAAVFDELLGTVNVANGLGAMTGTLTVRYRRPVPLGPEIRMEGRQAGVDGRKVYAEGTMWDGETLLAESEGVFVQVVGDLRDRLRFSGP
jgi:acyl-coenzyme A thioesterase PaaI-like protein